MLASLKREPLLSHFLEQKCCRLDVRQGRNGGKRDVPSIYECSTTNLLAAPG